MCGVVHAVVNRCACCGGRSGGSGVVQSAGLGGVATMLVRDAKGFRAKGRRTEWALRTGVGDADAPCAPKAVSQMNHALTVRGAGGVGGRSAEDVHRRGELRR